MSLSTKHLTEAAFWSVHQHSRVAVVRQVRLLQVAAPIPRPLSRAAAERLAACRGQYRHQRRSCLRNQINSFVSTTLSFLPDTLLNRGRGTSQTK